MLGNYKVEADPHLMMIKHCHNQRILCIAGMCTAR